LGNVILIEKIQSDSVFSVWLIAENELLKQRIMESNFYQGANNPEKVIENYLHRSEWHNKILLEQCKATNQKFLRIGENTRPDEVAESIYGMIDTAV